MKQHPGKTRILIIDRQDYWRVFSTRALEEVGFSVYTLNSYDYSSAAECVSEALPDLVILGCSGIGFEENRLIELMMNQKHRLLVLCTSLSRQVMRLLFLSGVDDVAVKPYDSTRLVNTVGQSLENIAMRDRHRFSASGGAR